MGWGAWCQRRGGGGGGGRVLVFYVGTGVGWWSWMGCGRCFFGCICKTHEVAGAALVGVSGLVGR